MPARLAVHDLTLTYQSPGGYPLPALGPISFAVDAGAFVSVIGPSGCGKSTLIRILAGLVSPTTGQALLAQQAIRQPSSRVGVMFQEANLMPWRTVIENIALPLELTGVNQAARRQAALDWLPRLGLGDEFADAYPSELSGGMAQRVALGRVLIQQPDVLLLDEPFGALDSLTREQITLDLMRVWALNNQTVLMVTHNIQEAILLSDRILVLSQRPGQLIADIPVDLPRPRHIDDSYRAEFGAIASQVRIGLSGRSRGFGKVDLPGT